MLRKNANMQRIDDLTKEIGSILESAVMTDFHDVKIWYEIAMEIIKLQPTVDAVPVIRCKDCKYYEETDETIGTCLLTASGAHVNGYCAWAERRGEEE